MTSKDKHYTTQLRAALTAGAWMSNAPGKAPNGTPLPWPELLRKFNKHSAGQSSATELAVVAEQTQALALLIGASAAGVGGNVRDAELDGDAPWAASGALTLGNECELAPERVDEARAGYDALKGVAGGSKSVQQAIAYHAYALGRPEECLSILSAIPDIHIATAPPVPPSTSGAGSLGVPRVPSMVSVRSISGPQPADIGDGRAWASTEAVRSLCLQGMSLEKLYAGEPSRAIASYTAAVPLVQALMADLPRPAVPTSTSGSGTLDAAAFARYREFWRWAERTLWRGIILLARSPPSDTAVRAQLLSLLALYRSCAWPPAFRPQHRTSVYSLHMRLLVLAARAGPAPAASGRAPAWLSTARAIALDLQAVLGARTAFPRAAERNAPVLQFADLCVAAWSAAGGSGAHAGWLVDMLWWATRLTFNAPRILRHAFAVHAAVGDTALASRFLRLYTQVVGKAREAAGADPGPGGDHVVQDIDTDALWAQTCVAGARLLARMALAERDESRRAEHIHEAGRMVQLARTRMPEGDTELLASSDLAESVWEHISTIVEQDPRTRLERLGRALALAQRAEAGWPSPGGAHQLAILLARPGPAHDLAAAVDAAARAVEAGPGEPRHWHLLGLLTAAQGDWRKARSVLELGIALGDAALDTLPDEQANGVSAEVNGVKSKDFAADLEKEAADDQASEKEAAAREEAEEEEAEEQEMLLAPDALDVPLPSSLLLPIGDRPTASTHDRFAQALQLRMTQLALQEAHEGGEVASDGWRDVFAWYASRQGVDEELVRRTPHSSMHRTVNSSQSPEARRNSLPTADGPLPTRLAPLAPVPISVTPATPHSPQFPDGTADSMNSGLDDTMSGSSLASGASEALTVQGKDRNAGRRRVQRMVKKSVNAGQARINTISRKLGNGVARSGSVHLRRSRSVTDMQDAPPYQASSIHLRRFYTPSVANGRSPSPENSEHPPVPAPPAPASSPSAASSSPKPKQTASDQRLLSDLWLMSAATFRRLGKIEQARGAIQEAEVTDEANPAVWVQLGLYFAALGNDRRAEDTLQKALILSPDYVPALVHLTRLQLARADGPSADVDLAAGMLERVTRGAGWDVPEVWHLLAKAYGLQGRAARERECLLYALELAEGRSVREIGAAVGWVL